MGARNSMSENLQQKIDDAVKKLAGEAYEVALKQVRDNREAMDSIVEVLLQKETISGHEFREMLAKYVTIPAGNMPAPSEEGSYVPRSRALRDGLTSRTHGSTLHPTPSQF